MVPYLLTSRYVGGVRWDPRQYARFGDQRARPFVDLLARVGAAAPRRVVDLGCGDGSTTALLAQRWPGAQVTGLDSSADMIAAARPGPRLTFAVGDVREWVPAADVLVCNAVLQWVPGHADLLHRWAAALPPGGWLALQVPGNFAAPSHVLLQEVAGSARWEARLRGVLREGRPVLEPAGYAALLLGHGLVVDVWETTYLHLLAGADAVLEWVRGTALRPVLAALSPAEAAAFEAEYAAALRTAYPRSGEVTPFPFRRVFAVATRA
jgi:trans-aconitate 2-methyltransferase